MERYELNCDEPTNPNQPTNPNPKRKRKINKNPPKINRKRKGVMGESRFPHSKYSIEKILHKIIYCNIVWYQIKWVGYSTPTWVRKDIAMQDIPEMVMEFENGGN